MNLFSYGPLTPLLAYAASYVGCLLGLMCAERARVLTGRARHGWIFLASVSIGGTGMWVMHFIAMLGFSLDGTQVRYRIVPTILSALLAIVAVGAGLVIAGTDARKVPRLVIGGLVTGATVTAMHHLGMSALVVPGRFGYEPAMLASCVLIAATGSVLTLRFSLMPGSRAARLGASALLAVALCGMHYTGMASMHLDPSVPGPDAASDGAAFHSLLLPLLLVVGLGTVILLLFVTFSASPEELVDDARFEERLTQLRRARQQDGNPQSEPDVALTADRSPTHAR